MPRVAKALKHQEVDRLKHPGDREAPFRYAVGTVSGLLLQITRGGGRSWVLRLTVAGKRRELGLGAFPEVTLAAAHEAAREAKAKARQGIDPVQEKLDRKAALVADQRKAHTYSQAVDGWMTIHKSKSEKNRQLTRNRLRTYSEDALGGQRVGSIDKHAIKRVLEPIWEVKTTTATRLREDMKKVFDWAIGNDHMDGPNPAEWVGNLEYMMKPPEKQTTHRPAVAPEDQARWMAELRKRGGNGSRALEFLVLTAARSGEVRGACWDEIDLKRGLWTIPAARMKMSTEHRVPLPAAAQALLSAMPQEGSLIFPAERGGELSDMTLSAAMKRIHRDEKQGFVDAKSGRPAVPHGWRSAFRSWAADAGYPRELAETALAHKVGNAVEQAYQRSDMLERRRAMMDAWVAHLNGEATDNVVALHG